MSFRDYLCYVRVEESKRLLQSTNYCMAEIATAVGFPDQSYYCKAFKRLVGIPPENSEDERYIPAGSACRCFSIYA